MPGIGKTDIYMSTAQSIRRILYIFAKNLETGGNFMELRELEYVTAIADAGSLSKAADRL